MKDELREILNDSTLLEVEVEYLADKLETLLAPTIERAEKYDAMCLIKDPIQVEREYFQELVRKADQWDALGYVTAYVEPENYDDIKEKAEKWNALRESGCRCEMYNSPSCTRCNLEGGQDVG